MKDFFLFSKRIDPKVKYVSAIKGIKSMPLILQLKHDIDNSINRKLNRIGFKTKYDIPFIRCICGSLPVRNFDSLKALVEINKIYYDDKARLMGKIFPPSDHTKMPIQIKSQLLNGRGVAIGFIDTGIRKKILAFKDFVQNRKEPYDDSDHGTAAIAVSSIPASGAGIVCAKAFDMSDHGFYSDIMASMNWILELKEKHNIKIIVLNFGVSANYKFPDILTIAAEELWKNGLLVVSCAGNMGPQAATITTPGCSEKLLTVGAFDVKPEKPFVLPWSSRGPGQGNAYKPDLVMPGHLASEGFMGTSASASLAAGLAALLYERKPDISPDDAKSLLKLCCASLGELKQAQGKGYIDIKKIEEV
ncbi:MAG: S8 family serine peptidase [Lutispora sp.]|nr:S8 family serine peptidase [Lutispora sp.]MDD4834547.1 S8 family serine peptidase [Lutispora sp.]